MDAFRIFLVIGAIVVLAIVVLMYLRDRRRRTAALPARDDLRRAGESGESGGTDSGTAGQRATGSTSWMRPGGGPGL